MPPSVSRLMLAAVAAAAATATGGTPVSDDGQWSLVFEDNFTAPTLNPSSWRVADNFTHGDQEWQLYLEDDVYVESGNLVIRTQVRDVVDKQGKLHHFSSGWVDTSGLVELGYGKFEAVIKLPVELPGLWPAYWLGALPRGRAREGGGGGGCF